MCCIPGWRVELPNTTPQHMHQPLLVILVQTCWDFFLLLFPFFLSCFLFSSPFVCWGWDCTESFHKKLKSSNFNLSVLKIAPGNNSGTKRFKVFLEKQVMKGSLGQDRLQWQSFCAYDNKYSDSATRNIVYC